MALRDRVHHLSDLLEGDVPFVWERDWPELLAVCCMFVLTGPFLGLAYWIQRWNIRTPWDADDQWAGTKQFAVTFVVCDLCLILVFLHFQAQLSILWFPTGWSLYFLRLFIWYVYWTLLAPALALLLERFDPRTRPLERVLLPSEQQPVVPRATRKRTDGSKAGQATAAPKKRKKGRAVPLGQLLLEEREAQRQQARQIHFHQPPQLTNETDGSTASPSSQAPETVGPSSEAKAPKTPEGHQPESLDHLF
jgi:hypothetical protein